MNYASSLVNLSPFRAVLLRELHAALINRYFQVFAALSIAGGVATHVFSEDTNAIAFWIVQIALYLVSLFALLAGVSSAQAEKSEWQLMFAQPVARRTYLLGKFAGYVSIFAAALFLLFIPAMFAGANKIALLYGQTLLLAVVFLALGLTIGFLAHERAQAVIIAACAWLLLLVVVDLAGLFAARFEMLQRVPDIWLALLMLNPLDAFRVHALFALEQIPAEAANKTPLAGWWIDHGALWFAFVAALWTAALVSLTSWRLNRLEL